MYWDFSVAFRTVSLAISSVTRNKRWENENTPVTRPFACYFRFRRNPVKEQSRISDKNVENVWKHPIHRPAFSRRVTILNVSRIFPTVIQYSYLKSSSFSSFVRTQSLSARQHYSKIRDENKRNLSLFVFVINECNFFFPRTRWLGWVITS